MTWRLIGWKISEVKCYYSGCSGHFDCCTLRSWEGETQAPSLGLKPGRGGHRRPESSGMGRQGQSRTGMCWPGSGPPPCRRGEAAPLQHPSASQPCTSGRAVPSPSATLPPSLGKTPTFHQQPGAKASPLKSPFLTGNRLSYPAAAGKR